MWALNHYAEYIHCLETQTDAFIQLNQCPQISMWSCQQTTYNEKKKNLCITNLILWNGFQYGILLFVSRKSLSKFKHFAAFWRFLKATRKQHSLQWFSEFKIRNIPQRIAEFQTSKRNLNILSYIIINNALCLTKLWIDIRISDNLCKHSDSLHIFVLGQ